MNKRQRKLFKDSNIINSRALEKVLDYITENDIACNEDYVSEVYYFTYKSEYFNVKRYAKKVGYPMERFNDKEQYMSYRGMYSIKDSINFDYDFDQVMYAVYEGEYDGELGQFDLPRFKKTEELIQKIWDEKYNNIDDWREVPWAKEEKDTIFESARNEAKMLDRMNIYNSRARYQSYDETRRVLKEVFGIDNKYLHDPKYDSCSNNKKKKAIMSKDSLDKRQRSTLAKHVLNCYSDRELLDIIYELIDWDNKLFDEAMDIYEENGSVQYRAKKISDLLTY